MSERGILSIDSYIPEERLDAIELSSRFDLDKNFVRNKTDFETPTHRSGGEETPHLAERAIRTALSRYPGAQSKLGLLIVVTQRRTVTACHKYRRLCTAAWTCRKR
jgi:3-oxoacyl-[acyl-carrier-protein] synthase III